MTNPLVVICDFSFPSPPPEGCLKAGWGMGEIIFKPIFKNLSTPLEVTAGYGKTQPATPKSATFIILNFEF